MKYFDSRTPVSRLDSIIRALGSFGFIPRGTRAKVLVCRLDPIIAVLSL